MNTSWGQLNISISGCSSYVFRERGPVDFQSVPFLLWGGQPITSKIGSDCINYIGLSKTGKYGWKNMFGNL